MTIATPTTDALDARIDTHWSGLAADSRWLMAAQEVADELAPGAAHHDRTGAFVADAFDLLRSRGFMSMLVPAVLGGGGASHAEACAALAELARGCPATSLALSMHTHLVAAQVWRHRRGLAAPALVKVASNELVLISTGASDWVGSNGSAVAVDGGYRISARKMPASGCPAGDVVVTSIRWEDAPDGPQVLHVSIPFSADGVSIEETWDSMGMRGTGSHTIVFDDVFVPVESVALIRPADAWHPAWSTVLGAALPLIMSTYIGIAEVAAEQATDLAAGKAERPDVARTVGSMFNQLTLARDTVRAMIDASENLSFDNTLDSASLSLTRKTNATNAVLDAVRLALEVGGGAAFSVSAGIERLFRDAHGALYHPLPAGQQQQFTGRVRLGLDPID